MEHIHFENGEAHPMTDTLEDMLIAEEEGIEEYWSSLADCVYQEQEEVSEMEDATNIDHLFV